MSYIPSKVFLTKGVGTAKDKLRSFEDALRDAHISQFNLVSVSSILPPHCKIVTPKSASLLMPGQIVHCVLSQSSTNEPGRLINASTGLAVPRDRSRYGYISEHHGYGEVSQRSGDYAEDLAAQMLATILNVPFDVDKNWDERREFWKISNEIVFTRNITQTAKGNPKGLWTTVVAAAVFIP